MGAGGWRASENCKSLISGEIQFQNSWEREIGALCEAPDWTRAVKAGASEAGQQTDLEKGSILVAATDLN